MLPRSFVVRPESTAQRQQPPTNQENAGDLPTAGDVEMSINLYEAVTRIGSEEKHLVAAEWIVSWKDRGDARFSLLWEWTERPLRTESDWIPFYKKTLAELERADARVLGLRLVDRHGGMVFGPYPEDIFRKRIGELKQEFEALLPGIPFGTPSTESSAAK